MSPKRSASAKKSTPRKSAAKTPAADSPMKAHEIAHGPNITGHDDQAQAAHRVPASTEPAGSGSIEVARENTPPSPAAPSGSDEGQRS